MHVVAVALLPDVSLTLVEERGEWRFARWAKPSGDPLPQPSAEYLVHRFPSPHAAETFFRSIFIPGS
jgi:hypothetical protein